MSRYLMKYVGTYRVKSEYDIETNDFPRDAEGGIDSTFEDLYIDCANGCRIMHYESRGALVLLQAYIPSISRGRKVLRELKDIIITSSENDSEVMFLFNSKDIKVVADRLKAKVSGSSISPFSVKNLPKTYYEIDTDDLEEYKGIIKPIPKNDFIYISLWTKQFMADILEKTHHIKGINEAIKREGLSIKNYIHKHGYWDEYCSYLDKCVKERYV